MRLLKCSNGKFELTDDLHHDIPEYAILSHTWGPDTEEVSFRDLAHGTGEDKIGYEKIRFCAGQASRDGLQYFWIDTCCINKSDSSELNRSINSMFRWYRNAVRCYVYLSGLQIVDDKNEQQPELAWESAFRAHRWFTRGWTLQELLAPESVEFFAPNGRLLGNKSSLGQQIHEITGIAVSALRGSPLDQFEIDERFKWAETRQTTHEEDWAYCLLGIFNIFMPLIYGEGKEHAVRRLKKAIADSNDEIPSRQRTKNRNWIVPFERNPSFTGRESELERLHEALFTGNHTEKIVITGLGGIGKTQLVLELVYQISAEHKECSIIWISATSKEGLGQAYLHAAEQLGIPGWEDNKTDAKKLVRDHLSSESAGQWLLVFDNADDIGVWLDKSASEFGRLIDCLPNSKHGAIIFTTRDKKAAVTLSGRGQNVVELLEMDEDCGKRLLEKWLIDQDLLWSQEDTTALLSRLAYLPLAIVQAAGYVNANRIGLRDYLSLLEEQEEDVIELLSEDFGDEGRDRAVKNPVATTWLVSFEKIRRLHPLAADCLSLMACVDTKDIPLSLLPLGPSRKKGVDAMGTLKGYSFISMQSANSPVNIHRLVHLACRNWLRKEGLLLVWAGRAITRLAEVLGNVGHDNRAVWRSYMPHMYYALGARLADEYNEDRLNLLWKYGMCLYYDGRYQEAEEPFERVMETRKTKLGVDHPDTLTSMGNLASTYWNQGRLEEAKRLEIQVIEAHKEELGADHPLTLTSIANLALTHQHQGQWQEAEKLFIQVMEAEMRILGKEHPETLISMANLASILWKQDRCKEAEELEVRVVELRKMVLGEEHPSTLISMANLASTYSDQGQWEEAEELEAQVIKVRERVLGEEHPDTLISLANLASTFSDQGRWKEAEELEARVMEIRKRVLGDEHPDTLTSMADLASTLWDQDRCKEAEELEVRVMRSRKRVLGEVHPDTLTSMANLAHTWNSQGRFKEAIDLMQDCVLGRQQRLGSDHPDTESSWETLTEWQEASRFSPEKEERANDERTNDGWTFFFIVDLIRCIY